ncbi:MAG: hypothetical protein RL757_1428 [Bacteroidota bacterium]|jgi:mRNA interferase HigB
MPPQYSSLFFLKKIPIWEKVRNFEPKFKAFYFFAMRIITKRRLQDFIEMYPDAEIPLVFWYNVVKNNDFYTPQSLTSAFKGADYVGNNRIVFNIAKNKYRLIAKFEFHEKAQLCFVRFIGTHKAYDLIEDIKNI